MLLLIILSITQIFFFLIGINTSPLVMIILPIGIIIFWWLINNPSISLMFLSLTAIIKGYFSDFGRTLSVGESDSELKEVYEIVIESAKQGLSAVRPGALASDVDRATRKVIEDAGYGDKFRHRTGHCIGMDVHEYPFISEEDDTPLEVGMTFTIEPSIFWPGRVGARIEDIVVVTENGGEKLNNYHEDFVTVEKVSAKLQSEGGCAHDNLNDIGHLHNH